VIAKYAIRAVLPDEFTALIGTRAITHCVAETNQRVILASFAVPKNCFERWKIPVHI
jgi:hypothetical protein